MKRNTKNPPARIHILHEPRIEAINLVCWQLLGNVKKFTTATDFELADSQCSTASTLPCVCVVDPEAVLVWLLCNSYFPKYSVKFLPFPVFWPCAVIVNRCFFCCIPSLWKIKGAIDFPSMWIQMIKTTRETLDSLWINTILESGVLDILFNSNRQAKA